MGGGGGGGGFVDYFIGLVRDGFTSSIFDRALNELFCDVSKFVLLSVAVNIFLLLEF